MRAAVLGSANALVAWILQQSADAIDMAYRPKPGEVYKGRVERQVRCLFGEFTLRRDYYHDPKSKGGHSPTDQALGLEGAFTPGLARLACLAGAQQASFQAAEADLKAIGGIKVPARQIQRLVEKVGPWAQRWQARQAQPGTTDAAVLYVSADGTGVPARREELVGVQGRRPDGPARTRQAYLGCVFTQHRRDEGGRPVRDWESTTYVSSLESSDVFGPLLRQEAIRRGMGQARVTVFLVDGATALEALGRSNFPEAVQIVDFYHALEHAGAVVEALLGSKDHSEYKARRTRWARRLLQDGVARLIQEAREEAQGLGRSEAVDKALHYFEANVKRMQYRTFRRSGYFIGSGVVEAGCKTVIGQRCKQSGMFWSRRGAEHILALRCITHSRRLDSLWKDRRNQIASGSDPLAFGA